MAETALMYDFISVNDTLHLIGAVVIGTVALVLVVSAMAIIVSFFVKKGE